MQYNPLKSAPNSKINFFYRLTLDFFYKIHTETIISIIALFISSSHPPLWGIMGPEQKRCMWPL